MTSNHLLLYRIAELMLEHEQHILTVDLLFDDEQIRDFVKSIQIDSPYQQMLYEGVLTESVRDEKLFVSFTVEGYFHYVLGEVIYNQTKGKSPESLKQIVEENKLNGAKEGVEQCLIRDLLLDDLTRLMWLIDEGGKVLEVCSIPLANAFLKVKGITKTENEKRQLQQIQVYEVFNQLFKNITDNDISILEKSIDYLKSVQQNKILEIIFIKINETIPPKNINNAILYVDSIQYIAVEKREKQLDNILQIEFETNNSELLSLLYQRIASQFDFISKYDKALIYYEKCLDIQNNTGIKNTNISLLYHKIGLTWDSKFDFEKALKYLNLSLDIYLKNLSYENEIISTMYHDIGVVWNNMGNYHKALEYYLKCLEISTKILGKIHHEVSASNHNIGVVWNNIGEFDIALTFLQESSVIFQKLLGDKHPDLATCYNNIGYSWSCKGDFNKALEFYHKSIEIQLNSLGDKHPDLAHSYSNIGDLYKDLNKHKKAIIYFVKGYKILYKGGFPFKIAQCYEALNQPIEALDYYIQSSEIRKEDIGIDDEATQEAISNAKRLAKELNKEKELPKWMK